MRHPRFIVPEVMTMRGAGREEGVFALFPERKKRDG
jgi:hypothetical protein